MQFVERKHLYVALSSTGYGASTVARKLHRKSLIPGRPATSRISTSVQTISALMVAERCITLHAAASNWPWTGNSLRRYPQGFENERGVRTSGPQDLTQQQRQGWTSVVNCWHYTNRTQKISSQD